MTHKISSATAGKGYRQRAALPANVTILFQDVLTNPRLKFLKKNRDLFTRFFSLFTCLKNRLHFILANRFGAAFLAHLLTNLLLTTKFSVL